MALRQVPQQVLLRQRRVLGPSRMSVAQAEAELVVRVAVVADLRHHLRVMVLRAETALQVGVGVGVEVLRA
jgi:hypothetical protein